jgi:hypothetical protein
MRAQVGMQVEGLIPIQRVQRVVQVESLSHLMFECPATSAHGDEMWYDEIRSLPGCAEKMRSLMSLPDASSKVLRFVSDDVWDSS